LKSFQAPHAGACGRDPTINTASDTNPPPDRPCQIILELQHFSGFCQAGNKKYPRGPAEEMGER
jgi:hypothetical protein